MSEFQVNSFQVPNALVDELLSELSGSELKCYLFIVRKTRGWQKSEDAISVSQFIEGTKLSNRQIIDSCNKLVELGLVSQKTGVRGVKIFSINQCNNVTSEKTSPVKKVPSTSEKTSQVLVKKVHTQKDTLLNTLIQKTNNIPRTSKPDSKLQKPEQVSEQVWEDFIKHRRSKKSPITKTALTGIIREAEKAGWTLEAALIECLQRGWTGFKADWVNKPQTTQNQTNGKKAWDFDAYLEKPTMRTVNDEGVLPCLN